MPKIQMRHDTAANWKTANPTLASGEWSIETDTKKMKLGDGVTAYNSLDYFRDEDNEWEKPEEWIDIRSAALPNSVYFLVGHSSDYSTYPDFGVYATISNSGTYDVYIDGRKRFTTASGTATTINWQSLALVSGWDVTYPSSLKTHVVRVTPNNQADTFTFIHPYCEGTLGVLWAHFTITNAVTLGGFTYNANLSPRMHCYLLESITSSTGVLKLASNGVSDAFRENRLSSIPTLDLGGGNVTFWQTFANSGSSNLKTIRIKNGTITSTYKFNEAFTIEHIETENVSIPASQYSFSSVYKLKNLPSTIDFTNSGNLYPFLTNARNLNDTVLDVSKGNGVTRLGVYGSSSYPMNGLKGITVSPEAPFDNATSPQLDVSYTGLDRPALVNLFKSMPYNVGYTVVGSPTISNGGVSGFSTSDYLQLPMDNNFFNQNFEMVFAFTTPSTWPAPNATIFEASRYRPSSANADASMILLVGTNSSSTNRVSVMGSYKEDGDGGPFTASFVANTSTKYYVKVVQQEGVVTASYSTDNVNFTQIKSESGYGYSGNLTTYPRIGRTNALSDTTVDLNNTYIKINGIPWFGPGVTKNLVPGGTVVGSPTVTNGIVSGFSSSKYIKANIPTDFAKYELVTRIKTPSSSPSTHRHVIGCLETNWTNLGFTLQTDMTLSGRFVYLNSNNTKTFAHIDTAALDTNAYYFVKYEIDLDEGTRKFSYSADGSTWVTNQQSIGSGQTQVYDSVISFGYGYNYSEFTGSIDLNNTYIKVDNSYVYRGMVPQVKTCSIVGTTGELDLTAQDKAIVLNKGWALTTNNTN